MPGKALAVDGNILVRAVLGKHAREVIERYADRVSFLVPEAAYAEAEEHLPALVIKRGGDPEKALALLRALGHLVDVIGSEVYGEFEAEARQRLERRDPEDWPVLATALTFGCPIWTEDNRFLRVRGSNVDLQSRRDVPSRMMVKFHARRCICFPKFLSFACK